MEVNIIILEDDPKLGDDSLVWELKDRFGEDKVFFISRPSDGLAFIKANLDRNLIVLLDIDFSETELNGHQLLLEISKISQLIPVILWSGVDENKETFSDFINNNAFGFISKTATTDEAFFRIDKAVDHLRTSIDNTIEDWILDKDDDKDKLVYFTGDGSAYSLNQILYEIRHQTDVGLGFAERLNKLTIDLLLRKKERLNG